MKSSKKNPIRPAGAQSPPAASPPPTPAPPPNSAPVLNLMIRLAWLLYGNAVLGICWFGIAGRGIRAIALADIAYFATALLMIAARYIDIKHFNGLTSEGEPATMAHFRSYAIVLGAVVAGLWLLAQFIAAYKWL